MVPFHCINLFFFNDTATTEIYTLSLHDALPIYRAHLRRRGQRDPARADRDDRPRPAQGAAMSFHDDLMALSDKLVAQGESERWPCPDPVNAAMIRNWTQALGDSHDWGETAPPAMIQVWSMLGLGAAKHPSPADEPLRRFNDNGFTGVVATNCEQVYDRRLRLAVGRDD